MSIKVRQSLMSSDRQSGNQGQFGFVPTCKEIVDMELNLIDFSELKENKYPINICDLSGGTGDQLNWMHNYLLEKSITTKAYYNEISEDRYKVCTEKYPYMNTLNTDFFSIKVGTNVNKALNKKVFSIVRNNPPYMYIERRGLTVRAELEFFLQNSLYDISGGIQILEVPIHQLIGIKGFLNMMCYRYDVFIAKFPKGEFEKFKQVVVICKKKKSPSSGKERVNEIIKSYNENTIPYLDEVKEKVFTVSKDDFMKTKEIDIFRDKRVSEETLFNGLNDVLDSLIVSEKKDSKEISYHEELKPLIQLGSGHISQILAAGRFDGLMDNLLVRGGIKKEVVTEVTVNEDGTEVTIETEALKPYIELTNKNGDIVFKDF